MVSEELLYRCAYVISGKPVKWDDRNYVKRKHAYNRMEKLKKIKNYKKEIKKGQWEVMRVSGWYRDNGKYNAKIKAYEWELEYSDRKPTN